MVTFFSYILGLVYGLQLGIWLSFFDFLSENVIITDCHQQNFAFFWFLRLCICILSHSTNIPCIFNLILAWSENSLQNHVFNSHFIIGSLKKYIKSRIPLKEIIWTPNICQLFDSEWCSLPHTSAATQYSGGNILTTKHFRQWKFSVFCTSTQLSLEWKYNWETVPHRVRCSESHCLNILTT